MPQGAGEQSGLTGRRAVLISSPAAGNALRAEQLAARLRRVGIAVAESLPVSALDHAQPQGNHWLACGYDLAIAAGGDGTIGSVATQLAGSGLPLAILPMGTANDVARSLRLPMDLDAACAAIAGAIPAEIDAGQAFPGLTEPGAYSVAHPDGAETNQPSPIGGVHFLHAATLGMNVEFARLATDVQRRQRLGSLTYAASALEAVTHYRPLDLTLHVYGMEAVEGAEGADSTDATAETVIHSHAVQLSIVNTPVFGGRMGMRLPDISLRDRQLDFMLIEAMAAGQLRHVVQQLLDSIGAAANHTGASPAHEQNTEAPHLPGVRRFRARAAVIETAATVDVTLDGEIRTHTPVLVRVAPHRLRVLVTPETKRLLALERRAVGPDADDAGQ